MIPSFAERFLRLLPYSAPVFPLLLVGLVWTLATFQPLSAIQRYDRDMPTLNARTIVWGAAATRLQDPEPIHWIGYGYEGHFISRVSREYVLRFIGYVNPLRVGLHNAGLQYVFDIGYVGLALFLISYSGLLRTVARSLRNPGILPGLGVALYLLLAGTSEAIPTPYTQELFLVFMILLITTALFEAKEFSQRQASRLNHELASEDQHPEAVRP